MASLSKNQHFFEKISNSEKPVEIVPKQFNETVFISKSNNSVFNVKGKVTSITIEGCSVVNVLFEDIVSTIDIIGSKKINIQANGTVPTINIEKSAGVNVHLTSPKSHTADVVTSLSTEVNLIIPGKSQDDDPKEFPIPYQEWITRKSGFLHQLSEYLVELGTILRSDNEKITKVFGEYEYFDLKKISEEQFKFNLDQIVCIINSDKKSNINDLYSCIIISNIDNSKESILKLFLLAYFTLLQLNNFILFELDLENQNIFYNYYRLLRNLSTSKIFQFLMIESIDSFIPSSLLELIMPYLSRFNEEKGYKESFSIFTQNVHYFQNNWNLIYSYDAMQKCGDQCVITMLVQFMANLTTSNDYTQKKVWEIIFKAGFLKNLIKSSSWKAFAKDTLVYLYNNVHYNLDRKVDLIDSGFMRYYFQIINEQEQTDYFYFLSLLIVDLSKTNFLKLYQKLYEKHEDNSNSNNNNNNSDKVKKNRDNTLDNKILSISEDDMDDIFFICHERLSLLKFLDSIFQKWEENCDPNLRLFSNQSRILFDFFSKLLSKWNFSRILLNFDPMEKLTYEDSMIVDASWAILQILGAITMSMDEETKINLNNSKIISKTVLTFFNDFQKLPHYGALKMEQMEFKEQARGIKTLITRILTNSCKNNKIIQSEIRENGAILHILNGCKDDINQPYLREWSIFACKNLCEDNESNQNFIANLKAQGISADKNELEKYGIEAKIKDGKVELKRVDASDVNDCDE